MIDPAAEIARLAEMLRSSATTIGELRARVFMLEGYLRERLRQESELWRGKLKAELERDEALARAGALEREMVEIGREERGEIERATREELIELE